MTSPRFVLRYRGEGPAPEADVGQVHDLGGAVVVDASARMLLVEADDPGALRDLAGNLSDWILAPEQPYPLPDTRARVERPSG